MKSTPRQRNVLFVTTSSVVYGGELSLLPVVRRLDASWKAHFLVEGAGPLEGLLRNEGYPVYRLALNVPSRPRRALRLLRLLYLFRSRGIQFVHVNLHYRAGPVSRACRMAGIPVLVHVRNMIDRPVAPLFENCDGIICISRAVRNSLISAGQVPHDRIADRLWIIPDGRDLSPFHAANRERVRREWGIDPSVPLVGLAARICPMKGQDTFLRMAALVKRRVPAARFVLVGARFNEADEAYLQNLHELVRSFGLESDILFADYRHDMPDVLAALDCFAHPSRQGAFVSVLIETMASGVPVLASAVDGIPECVGRDGAGILLPPEDAAAWADAAVGVLTDPAQAARLSEKGRERAARLFDIVPLARRTAEVMETVYARCNGGDPHGMSGTQTGAAERSITVE